MTRINGQILTFRDDAHWNAERQAVEFGVEIGGTRRGPVVRVRGRVNQCLLPQCPTPERAWAAAAARFETVADRKLRRRAVGRGRECGDQ